MMEWRELIENKGLKYTYPKHPESHYKGYGWVNWNHFLRKGEWNAGTILPYYETRKKARKLNLISSRAYKKYLTEKNPRGLHKYPDAYYKEWNSWGDYLGTKF